MSSTSGVILVILRLALALALYAFLAWAMLLIWRDLKATGEKQPRKIRAIILNFNPVPGTPGSLRFTQQQVFVGRDPICECRVTNETVSIKHARLYYEHGQWWLEDLGSRNGTHLNEIEIETPTVLMENDLVRCGEVTFTVTFDT
ncbi:FHA domain-containing protein [Chloroflexota bacterium]